MTLVAGMAEPGNSPQIEDMAVSPLSVNLSERDFTTKIIDRAKARGWWVYHARPARTKGGGWTVPLEGHRGFPDLVLAKDGVTLFAELKSHKGKLTDAQKGWLEATNGALWRPKDWPRICEILDLPARAKAKGSIE